MAFRDKWISMMFKIIKNKNDIHKGKNDIQNDIIDIRKD